MCIHCRIDPSYQTYVDSTPLTLSAGLYGRIVKILVVGFLGDFGLQNALLEPSFCGNIRWYVYLVCMCVGMCMCTCMHAYVCICACVRACACVHVCAHYPHHSQQSPLPPTLHSMGPNTTMWQHHSQASTAFRTCSTTFSANFILQVQRYGSLG